MVEIEQLSFGYTRNRYLFNDLDLSISQGSMCGLLGRNGAGKTTLLRIISGLLFPTGGSSRVLGRESRRREPETLSNIYSVPEEFVLPEVSVKEFVTARAPFYPAFSQESLNSGLEELEVPREGRLNSMSYGQKKKFLIAFGIATGARLLILDEPTNGLDIPSKSRLRKLLISTISEERCFVISTHQVRDLSAILDPIVILDGGRILLDVDMETIGRSLSSRIQSDEPTDESVLWHERVPGGYQLLEPNRDGRPAEIDIELLFNAVIQQGERTIPLLGKGVHHAE